MTEGAKPNNFHGNQKEINAYKTEYKVLLT